MNSIGRQILIVTVTVIVFVALAALALYFGQGSGSITSREVETRQLTVSQTRDGAQGLSSAERQVESTGQGTAVAENVQSISSPELHDRPVDAVRGLGGADPLPAQLSETDRLIAEVLSGVPVQPQIDALIAHISGLAATAEASKVYSALGTVYLSQTNPNYAAAFDALQHATDTAPDKESRMHAALAEITALAAQDKTDVALGRMDAVLTEDAPDSVALLQLMTLRADLLLRKDDTKGAEAAYIAARKHASAAEALLGDEAAAVFNQASLRLAKLYERTGRLEEQESVLSEISRAVR